MVEAHLVVDKLALRLPFLSSGLDLTEKREEEGHAPLEPIAAFALHPQLGFKRQR